VAAALNYGGSLTVTNLGPDALVLGNSFQLFSATSYSGAFSTITLPPLSGGLVWSNQLLANGTITVASQAAPGIGGVTQTGTNLVFNVTNGTASGTWSLLTATNVVVPVTSWTTNSTGAFDGLGHATITNGVNAGEPKRFYRIMTP